MLPLEPKKLLPSKNGDAAHELAPQGSPSGVHYAAPETPAAPPAALQSAPSLGALLHSFRRSWKAVVPLALLAAAVAGAATWFLVPAQYTTWVNFRILSRPTLGMLDGEEIFANVQKAQMAYMKSNDIVSEAITKSRVAEQFGVTITPQVLQKKLKAGFNDGPEVMNVQLASEHPEAAACLLNALGEVYPRRVIEGHETLVKNTINEKEKHLRRLADKLHDARVLRDKTMKDAGIFVAGDVARSKEDALRRRERAESDLTRAKQDLDAMLNQRKAKERRIKTPDPVPVADSLAEADLQRDPRYQDLIKDIAMKRKQISAVARVVTPAKLEAATRKYKAELSQMEFDRQRMIENAKGKLAEREQAVAVRRERNELTDLNDRIEGAEQLKKSLVKELAARNKEVERFNNGGPAMPPEVQRARDTVDAFELEQKNVAMQVANLKGLLPITPRVTLHTEAFVPTEKEYSRPLKFALGAALLVFGVGMIGGCLLEARHRKVSASDDVRQGLGLRVIGTLPALPASARKKSAAALSIGGLDSQYGLTEAVDAVRTMLLHAPHADGARIVMVTSALQGEGKTTLASHLAASLSRAWRKTLLIDADLRNPNAHNQFELPLEPGLCEALRGEIEFEDAIKPTVLGRLWMLPAGKVDGHSLQALTQDGLVGVFERLKEQFDFIVIDTSPVVPVPDALMLGQCADAVLLSILRDVSCMPAVYAAQQKLKDLNIRVLGAVVIGEKTERYGRPVAYGPTAS